MKGQDMSDVIVVVIFLAAAAAVMWLAKGVAKL
ncbi:hypothetical membrane protein [Renibacterium salmoninarum ATCC 33209]|uniref:Hypothetical membrane protein n=1 Tax=Renibacterium salmoninarum (strain ATCC 33209 / DSM 20767 / JCM 11484 / NBRC 15589 / NCIMB 2235) TaxID=288705 RepID=A9WQL0_RENSM|nr:hypothetical membrane protein [Renibacterium salmoninarum ATCC 33209]